MFSSLICFCPEVIFFSPTVDDVSNSIFPPCLQLYGHDLELEFSHFQDWLKVFQLYKGKANVEDYEEDEEERFMGKYKVL